MRMRIIAAGGTFDKQYDPLNGQLVFGQTSLPEMLERARVEADCILEVLPLMDSLDMQEKDRERILEACRCAPESRILVIHGTDTMPETAGVLGRAALPKTIVLTGAMVPYTLKGSDALFNLGFGLGVLSCLHQGVHIAMHAQVFTWDTVRKNRAAGRFEVIR